MDTSEFDAKIANLMTTINGLKQHLENISQEFTASVARFAPKWLEKEVLSAIKRESEHAQKIGNEGVKALKDDFRALIQGLPDLITKHLGGERYWLHRQDQIPDEAFSPYRSYSGKPPTITNNPLSFILGSLAPILQKHKFINLYKDTTAFMPEDKGFALIHGSKDGYLYRYDIVWTEEMKNILTRYNNVYEDLMRATKDLKNVEEQKRSVTTTKVIEDLWENA